MADNDYAAASGTLNFAGTAGETKTITVPVKGDQKVEANETFAVNLANVAAGGRNVTLADAQGQGTISNDDGASLSINDVTLAEGNAGTTNFSFTVTLSAAVGAPVSVDFSTANGTATLADNDYAAASGTLNFAGNAGETKTIVVPVNGDQKFEPDETFLVNLTNLAANGGNVTLADSQGSGTITNDDTSNLPALTIGDATLVEGHTGTSTVQFDVQLSAVSSDTVTVNFATADGAAVAGVDYQAASGPLTFLPGETVQSISVTITGDTVVELDESFLVKLSGPQNAILADPQGVGTITNDDSAALSIDDVTLAEGNAGTTNATFTVTLSAAVDAPVSVDFSTADGTATAADKDYTAATGTVTFAPNETSQTISITVNGDTQVEPDEDFFVNLSNPTNATIADSQGIGTITNDDSTDLPTLSISDVTRAEGNDGTTSFTFTVTLNGPAGGPVSVDFTTADGTATAGDATTDGGTSGTDDDDGDGSQADDDGDDETDDHETEDPGDGDRADENGEQDGQGGTEHDAEDHNGAEHRGEDSEHEHGEESDGEGEDREHSGGAGGDYTPTSGTLHFTGAAGETQTITVDVQVDTQVEPDETFFVQLSNAVGAVIANGQGTGTITNDDTTTVRQRRWQNPRDQHDVNDADGVTALDVLMLINYINDHPGQASMPASDGTSPPYYDVSGDDACTAMDVLQVINRINQSAGRAGEGEAVSLAVAPAEPTQSVTPDSMPWPDLTDSSPAADPANPSSLPQDSANPSRSASTWPVPKQTNQAWSRAVSSQGNRLGGGLQESPFDREVDFSELEAVLSVIGQDVERAWQQF